MPKPAPESVRKVSFTSNELAWVLEGLREMRKAYANRNAWGCVDALFDLINKVEDVKEKFEEVN